LGEKRLALGFDMQTEEKDSAEMKWNRDNKPPKDAAPKDSNESGSEAAPETDSDVLEARLTSAEQTAAEFKDKYLRMAAEMENMRRRFDREKKDLHQYGNERIMQDLLPIIDSLEKALSADASDGQSVLAGVQMVQRQFSEILSRHGLEPVTAAGAAFDPEFHQAIQKIDSADVTIETVKDEFAKGYKLNGRLVRPAMVSVLVPAPETDSDENAAAGDN